MVTSQSHIRMTMSHINLIQLDTSCVLLNPPMFRASWRNCAGEARELLEPFSVRSDHHYCHQWWQNCASRSMTRSPDSQNATYISYVWAHPVSICPSELNPYIHQPSTHTLTLIIYLKKTRYHQSANKNLNHKRYSFFAFRRRKKERHSSYSQIYNYSSLKG